MSGSTTDFKYRGIIPRAISQIYSEISNKFDQAVTIRVSYLELYQDLMFDLLSPTPTFEQNASKLSIIDDGRGGVAIKGLSMVVCQNEEEALNQLFEGGMNRTVTEHQLNKASSRSHCIFTIHIESRSRVESSEKVIHSKVHLVDLAGSERTKKTGSSGLTLKEANYINQSLSYLEQVVIALCEKKRDHVPYRQARLTNILRDSIGGNCKTLMIANVWPEPTHIEETISTLKFATRMMRVSNEAIVNVVLDPALQVKRYEKEIRDLKQELAMHDTLANRGRITYDSYSPDQMRDIQKMAVSYLGDEIDEIEDIDSLRKARELFHQIRNQYRKLKQSVETIQKQADEYPGKQLPQMEEIKKEQHIEGHVEGDEGYEEGDHEEVHVKRPWQDKQSAFLEYKSEGDGRKLESAIVGYRNELKMKRQVIKDLTEQVNLTKKEIDRVKRSLDHKAEEKKGQLKDEFGDADDQPDDIIDEEELHLLREMKDLKKGYRENFDRMKNVKVDSNDIQTNIDNMKQQLVMNFENWYIENFEQPMFPEATIGQTSMKASAKGETMLYQGEEIDEEAMAFIRAKKHVNHMHRAIRAEKAIKQRP